MKKHNLIQNLKKQFKRVRVQHLRNFFDEEGNTFLMSLRDGKETGYTLWPRGGMTILEVEDENALYQVESRCHDNDGFEKRRGIAIAAGRFIKNKENYRVENDDVIEGEVVD